MRAFNNLPFWKKVLDNLIKEKETLQKPRLNINISKSVDSVKYTIKQIEYKINELNKIIKTQILNVSEESNLVEKIRKLERKKQKRIELLSEVEHKQTSELYNSSYYKSQGRIKNLKIDLKPSLKIPDEKIKKNIVVYYQFNHKDCPFYKNKSCLIYNERPILCRAFPVITTGLISKKGIIIKSGKCSAEKKIAQEICDLSRHKLINLADRPLTLGELKALFFRSELVISNDTGPRHIAISLGRKVITLFGPNDPVWTDTNYENEIEIVGNVPCAPCTKPICKRQEHLCMQAITVEMVCEAAKKVLKSEQKKTASEANQNFMEVSESFFVDSDYKNGLSELGLTSIDAVFSFNTGVNMTKDNLAIFRSRLQFNINSPPTTVFLKRYSQPPILFQLKAGCCGVSE